MTALNSTQRADMSANTEYYSELIRTAWKSLDEEHRVHDIDQFFADDFIRHAVGRDYSRDEFASAIQRLVSGFPNLRFSLLDIISEGERVAYRWSSIGTHLGYYLDVPPTYRSVEVVGITIARFEGDRFAESWAVWNEGTALHELGIIPIA